MQEIRGLKVEGRQMATSPLIVSFPSTDCRKEDKSTCDDVSTSFVLLSSIASTTTTIKRSRTCASDDVITSHSLPNLRPRNIRMATSLSLVSFSPPTNRNPRRKSRRSKSSVSFSKVGSWMRRATPHGAPTSSRGGSGRNPTKRRRPVIGRYQERR